MKRFLTTLLTCYTIWVNENYSFIVCDLTDENPQKQKLIEVTNSDGYKEPEPVTYEELVIHTNKLFDY